MVLYLFTTSFPMRKNFPMCIVLTNEYAKLVRVDLIHRSGSMMCLTPDNVYVKLSWAVPYKIRKCNEMKSFI